MKCSCQCDECQETGPSPWSSWSPLAFEQAKLPDLERADNLSLGGQSIQSGLTTGVMQIQSTTDTDAGQMYGKMLSSQGELYMRGISLRKTLAQAISFWLADPRRRTEEEKHRLYAASVKTKRLDLFLSHTWLTPGKWKFLSLLLQFGWPTVLICWGIGVILAFVLCMTEVLPLFRDFQACSLGYEGVIPSGCWVQICGFLGVLGGCVIFPYVPFGKSDQCFLDFACIHQTEKGKMQQGIMSISSFLAASDELRVVWSSPLLSRLWCVFEIAAFRKLNPQGRIVIAPLDNEASAAVMFLWWWVFCLAYWFARSGPNGQDPVLLLVIMVILFAALMPALALSVWRNHKSTAKLRSDLANFDVMKVDCTSEFDREYIHNAIIRWYGSLEAFSQHVRGPFSQEVLELMRSSGSVSCHYIFLPISPLVCQSLDYVLALWKAGAPAKAVVSMFFNGVVALDMFFFPAMGVFFSWITKKGLWFGSRRCLPLGLEIGIIWLLCVVCSVAAAWACVLVSVQSLEMTVVWNVVNGLFAALVRHFCWRSGWSVISSFHVEDDFK